MRNVSILHSKLFLNYGMVLALVFKRVFHRRV